MLFEDKDMTISKARSKFTDEEMKQLRESGQHVVMRHGYFNYGDGLSVELKDKLYSLFGKYLEYVGTKEDVNGLIVETTNIIPQEREARREFRDFFVIYSPDEKTNGETLEEQFANHGRYDCTGLFVKFIRGLGIDLIFTEDSKKKETKSVLYGKDVGVSLITEDTARKQFKDLSLLRQQRWEPQEDGSIAIVCDYGETEFSKAISKKANHQGYNTFLLTAIGNGIEQIINESRDARELLSIPRSGLQDFIGETIRVPDEQIIDFIKAGRAPQTEEEKKLCDKILKSYSFWVELINLEKAGVIETEDGIYTIFQFDHYDKENDAIVCGSPYLREVYKRIYDNPILGKLAHDEPSYKIYKTSPALIKGTYYKIRNETTKQIVEEIIYRISRRGVESDAQKKKHYNYQNKRQISMIITYQSLIKECPLLKKKLTDKIIKKNGTEAEPDSNYKRTVLNRAIFGETYPTKSKNESGGRDMTTEASKRNKCDSLIEEIFREHTDFYKAYVNFKIKADPISLKNLSKTGIRITHDGKSGEYRNNPELHSPEIVL